MIYRYLVDGTSYGNPKGWETGLFNIANDIEKITWETTGSFTWTGAGYTYMKNTVDNDPCHEFEITIRAKCNRNEPFETCDILRVLAKDIVFDCQRCEATLTAQTFGFEQLITERGDDEVCLTCTPRTPFEIQSGSEYVESVDPFVEDQRCFIPVSDAMAEIVSEMSGGTVTVQSTFLTTDYRSQIMEVDLTGIVNGDVINLTFESQFGDTWTITVTASAVATPAELLRNTILYHDNFVPNGWRLVKVISCAEANGDIVTITTDFETANVALTINGVAGPAPVITQTYQYGFGNLAISGKGLDADNVCMSFNTLWTAIHRKAGLQRKYDPVNRVLIIEPGEDFSDGIAADSLGDFNTKCQVDAEWLVNKLQLGSQFEISNLEETLENWQWAGNSANDISVGDQAGGAYLDGDTLQFPEEALPFFDPLGNWNAATGVYTASGSEVIQFDLFLLLDRATIPASFEIQMVRNGAIVEQTAFISNPTSGVQWNSVSPIGSQMQEICLQAGDTIEFIVDNILPGAILNTSPPVAANDSPSSLSTTSVQCTDRPEFHDTQYADRLSEHTFDNNCSGTKDLRCDSSIWAGLGYGISQHMAGVEEYNDTYFFSFIEGVDDLYQFERCIYFEPGGSTCLCRDDEIDSIRMYNIPLQPPYLIENWCARLPFDANTVNYNFIRTFDGANYANADLADFNSPVACSNAGLTLCTIQGACLSPEVIKSIYDDGEVEISNCGTIETGIVKSLSFNNKTGITTITILS